MRSTSVGKDGAAPYNTPISGDIQPKRKLAGTKLLDQFRNKMRSQYRQIAHPNSKSRRSERNGPRCPFRKSLLERPSWIDRALSGHFVTPTVRVVAYFRAESYTGNNYPAIFETDI